jgi:hypothetical protein
MATSHSVCSILYFLSQTFSGKKNQQQGLIIGVKLFRINAAINPKAVTCTKFNEKEKKNAVVF